MRWLTAAWVRPRAFAAPVKLLNSAAFEKVPRCGSGSSPDLSASAIGLAPSDSLGADDGEPSRVSLTNDHVDGTRPGGPSPWRWTPRGRSG